MGMQLENIKEEFPVMPEEMRAMVKREVEKQVKTAPSANGRKKRMLRRYLIVAFAAVMVMGMTVFAGSLYRMHVKDNGKYGVDVSVERDGEGTADAEGAQNEGISGNPKDQDGQSDPASQEPFVIEPVKVTLSYLPEGMVRVEDDYGKYCYADAMYQGGVTVCLYRMDTGSEAFAMQFTGIADRQELSVNGCDGIYLKFSDIYDDEIIFNQRVYVMYPDQHYVLEMFAGSNVTKEDVIAIAEGVELTPATGEECEKYASVMNWSEYVRSMEEAEKAEKAQGGLDTFDEAVQVPKDRMNHTHAVGETFSLGADKNYSVRVAEVQVLDHVRDLNWDLLDSDKKKELSEATDADGNLLSGTMEYIKYGDGVDTLTEVVRQEQVAQKLVYMTIEYTNTRDTRMTDVLFVGNLLRIVEDGDNVRIREGKEPGAGDQWDAAQIRGVARYREMFYYDVHGGERGNNYIPAIEPGESVTVHLAWVVPEEELPYLYLNLDTEGGAYSFSDSALTTGYVDVRQ